MKLVTVEIRQEGCGEEFRCITFKDGKFILEGQYDDWDRMPDGSWEQKDVKYKQEVSIDFVIEQLIHIKHAYDL